MRKPIAVLCSDVHYSLHTLEIADRAFRAAIDKAAELDVPLIDCGDLTNDKAIIRAEVANRLIETMGYAKSRKVNVHLLVGNHSLINEKDDTQHALEFLRPFATIIDHVTVTERSNILMIPYHSKSDDFKVEIYTHLAYDNSILICHQGFRGAWMGDYIQDRSSVDPEVVKDFKVFSGHYHCHQTIETITYVGNPFTLSYGEANDPPKGFMVLFDDGSYERILLPYRRHVVHEMHVHDPLPKFNPDDLVLLKVSGPMSELKAIPRKEWGEKMLGHSNYRLELKPTDTPVPKIDVSRLTDYEIFDTIIDTIDETAIQKAYLKELWRELYESVKGSR